MIFMHHILTIIGKHMYLRPSIKNLLALFTVVAILGTTASPSTAQIKNLDHFLCTAVEVFGSENKKYKPNVTDQFSQVDTIIGNMAVICAPARKIHNGKEFKPKSFNGPHLACYWLHNRTSLGRVKKVIQVFDQFHPLGHKGLVGNRQFLCIPSIKIAEEDEGLFPRPKGFDYEREIKKAEAALDHFLCSYSSPRSRARKVEIELEDQFGTMARPYVRQPRTICAPAVKKLGKTETKTKNGLNGKHLYCYRFGPLVSTKTERKKIAVYNQLSKIPQLGEIYRRFMLCVPSDKKLI